MSQHIFQPNFTGAPATTWLKHTIFVCLLSLVGFVSLCHGSQQGGDNGGGSNQTNPPLLDSDGDGLSDHDEIHLYGTDWQNPDTDGDGTEDGEDGWAHDPNFAPARQGESYALVDLSSHLTYMSRYLESVQVDDQGGVLLASKSASGDDTTYSTKYYNWSQTLAPSGFNATLTTRKTFGQSGTATADYTVHLTRSGLMHFSGNSSLNEEEWETNIRNHRDFHDPFNVSYDANNQSSGAFIDFMNAYSKAGDLGNCGASELVKLSKYEYSNERYAVFSTFVGNGYAEEGDPLSSINQVNVSLSNGQVLSSGEYTEIEDATLKLSQTAYFKLSDTGAHGSQLTINYPAYNFEVEFDDPELISYFPDSETRWEGSATDGGAVISAQEQDILISLNARSYSLNGSTFHDFKVWNLSSKQLDSTAVGKTSDDLVMLLGGSNILINQMKRSVSDLVSNAEGWSNFKLEDINSHGMIVGTAEKGGATKVIALLKVDVEIHDEDGNPQIATEENPANIPVNGDFDEEKQTNGRYVRDYEDASLGFADDSTDLKTDDLRGCVVDIPGLDDSVWQNTTLKIRKKAGVIDPETNEEEAGEIRIHAIDGSNNWIEVPLDTDLAPEYYVSTGQYANYDSCWFEGIKDGPITIEVEVVINSGTPITVEKKAMICTEKTKAEWQQELYADIQLMLEVDVSTFTPSSEFTQVQDQVIALYEYYGLFYSFDEDNYLWMGLAKLAGAEAYAGMYDSSQGSNILLLVLAFTPYDDTINDDSLELLSRILQEGAINIFLDVAWQYKAYHVSGLSALYFVNTNEAGALNISDWEMIDSGIENSSSSEVVEGSLSILHREQFEIIQPSYNQMSQLLWVWVANWFGVNPVPGGQGFNAAVPGGNLMDDNDRWSWVTHPSKGIWPRWIYTPRSIRKAWTDESVLDLAAPHSFLIN